MNHKGKIPLIPPHIVHCCDFDVYCCDFLASLIALMVKNLPAMPETQVWSLGREDAVEKGRQPTPGFLPGESHGQRSLVGCSPWGHKELDTTERLSVYTHAVISPHMHANDVTIIRIRLALFHLMYFGHLPRVFACSSNLPFSVTVRHCCSEHLSMHPFVINLWEYFCRIQF